MAFKRTTRKRVSRALTKYVRNFTGTITRTPDGQVVIAGTGPKPKTAKNPIEKTIGDHTIRATRDGNVWVVRVHGGAHVRTLGRFASEADASRYIKKVSSRTLMER
jgi:hypothetical protein